jgi:hypothetical protein
MFLYKDDAGQRFGISDAVQPPDVTIVEIAPLGHVDYPCDLSSTMTARPNGSVSLLGLESRSNLVKGTMRLDQMCLNIFGVYESIHRLKIVRSSIFILASTSTGYQLVTGPIAHRPNAQYPCGTTEQPPPSFPSAYMVRRLPALPLSYLVEPTLASALARSHQQCRAMSTKRDGSLTNCRTNTDLN